jgi:glycosyltransferase involved in cell wall biosynthesis
MIKVSVYIICKNEEKHIKRVLESVKEFDGNNNS